MPPHPKMQKCYQKESIFIGAISRNNLPTIQVGRYIIMMINRSLLLCLLSYRNRLYSKRIKENNRQQNITTNINEIQTNDSKMWRYVCIGFIDFIIKVKNLLDYVNSFSPN